MRAISIITLCACLVLACRADARVLEQEGPCSTDVLTDAPRDISVLVDGGSNFHAVADAGNDRAYVGFGSPSNCTWRIGSTGTDDGEFDDPRGVVLDSDGFVYVADTGNERIQKFDTYMGKNAADNLGFLLIFDTVPSGSGPLGLSEPRGLGTYLDDGIDEIYVADSGNQRIAVFSSGGTFVSTFGSEDADLDPETFEGGTFFEPADVAVCGNSGPHPGRIYVLDGGPGVVQAFSPLDDGADFLFAFGRQGDSLGEFDGPASIALDFNCNVYVADRGNDRVLIFTPEGRHLELLSAPTDPAGVAVGNALFVAKEGSDSVARYEFIDWDTGGDGNIDDDGDALPDLWEEVGIDFDGNGTIDFVLPDADSQRKDVYVEVDFATGEEPMPLNGFSDNLELVEQAFADAPLPNPDGSTGITLHLERGDSIPELTGTGVIFDVDPPLPAGLLNFELYFPKIKSDYLGTPAQRNDANAANLLAAKELVYHYSVWAFALCSSVDMPITQCTGFFPDSGSAEIGGNDFVLALQSVSNAITRAGTFMHELGHNLGFGHGGRVDGLTDGTNCKPNYLSVMSYTMQGGIPNDSRPFNRRLDYSREELDPLDETDLDENAGVGATPEGAGGIETDLTVWSVDGTSAAVRQSRADLAIDWNDVGGLTSGVVLDVNNFPVGGCDSASPGDTLRGSNDWGQAIFNNRRVAFRNANGAELSATGEEEMSVDDLALLPQLLNRPPDCSMAEQSVEELWPPNHSFREVSISGVTDPDGDEVSVEVTSIFQDEPLGANGAGATCSDGSGLGDHIARVRAERSGSPNVPGDGRVYHIEFTASDSFGAECQVDVSVCVPHDRNAGMGGCVDGGALFDSTQCP